MTKAEQYRSTMVEPELQLCDEGKDHNCSDQRFDIMEKVLSKSMDDGGDDETKSTRSGSTDDSSMTSSDVESFKEENRDDTNLDVEERQAEPLSAVQWGLAMCGGTGTCESEGRVQDLNDPIASAVFEQETSQQEDVSTSIWSYDETSSIIAAESDDRHNEIQKDDALDSTDDLLEEEYKQNAMKSLYGAPSIDYTTDSSTDDDSSLDSDDESEDVEEEYKQYAIKTLYGAPSIDYTIDSSTDDDSSLDSNNESEESLFMILADEGFPDQFLENEELFETEYSLAEYENMILQLDQEMHNMNRLEEESDYDETIVEELDEDDSDDEFSESSSSFDEDDTDSIVSLNTLEKVEFDEYFVKHAPQSGCLGLMLLDLSKDDKELDELVANEDATTFMSIITEEQSSVGEEEEEVCSTEENLEAPVGETCATKEASSSGSMEDNKTVTGIDLTEAEPALIGDVEKLEKASGHSRGTKSTYSMGTASSHASSLCADETESLVNFEKEEEEVDHGHKIMQPYEDGNIEILSFPNILMEGLALEPEIFEA